MIETIRQRRGVLFDLDGVLLDSEGQYSIFWARMDQEHPTGIDNFAAFIKGFHLSRILSYFDSDKTREQVVAALLEFERNMRYEFFPGSLEFVRHLREAGLPMAIVTSSDRKKMQSLYSQHPEFPTLFDHIITGDMVIKAKPDPYCFLKGAELIGINIKDCVVRPVGWTSIGCPCHRHRHHTASRRGAAPVRPDRQHYCRTGHRADAR